MTRQGWRCRSIQRIRLPELLGSLQILMGAMVENDGLNDASLSMIWDIFMNEWTDV